MTVDSGFGHDDERVPVRRAIAGDVDAFGCLYTRHMHAIYRYLFLRVGDEQLAEDLTEEVFVRVQEALPRYKPGPYPFLNWLYRIAHNLLVDTYRKKRPLSISPSDLDREPDPEALPEDAVANRQDVAELVWAVQQLDAHEQQVIVLRFVEGLSHREVANIIGKNEGATRMVQQRAVAKLRKLLNEYVRDYR